MPIIEFKKSVIETNISRVAKAERITKALLSSLSRDLIAYVYETADVAMVNRLIQVLTPVNKKVAALYFPAMLGWSFDEATSTFGGKLKDKVFGKRYDAAVEFLSVDTNNIWVWADNEIVIAAKPKDYAKKITELVTKALKDEEQGIDAKELLFALLASDELTLGDLMAPLNEMKELPLAEVKEEVAA